MYLHSPLRIALIWAALTSTIKCAPTSPKRDTFSLRSAQTGWCGSSSFENETSKGSPLTKDCDQLAAHINGNADWTLTGGDTRVIVSYGTCGFKAKAEGGTTYVGNEDIRDLIQSAEDLYFHEAQIGASGVMHCHGRLNGQILVRWSLYKM